MLIEALEKERKALQREVYKKAKSEGRREGRREGKREGGIEQQTAIARKMLVKGFNVSVIAEVTGLSEAAIRQLKQKMEN